MQPQVDSTILSAWSSYTSHAEALTAAVAQQKAARQVRTLRLLCSALPIVHRCLLPRCGVVVKSLLLWAR